MWVGWRATGLEISARDWLIRQRGLLPAPDNIVIVTIDETSLKRFGRFPWSRSLVAQALDRLKDLHPKAIALDILYVDPTNPNDDFALAAAIKRAGNVIVAAQLTANEDEVNWLRPLPEIESAAAGVGHVEVLTGFDGVARSFLLTQADAHANPFRAMAIELIRVGDKLKDDDIRELPNAVMLGKREIHLTSDVQSDLIESQGTRPERIRAAHLLIDYIGPSGSFAAQTLSFSELIDGHINQDLLHGKYVLIGATAASIGGQVASPFIHSMYRGRLRSDLMPGVEVLANQVNTILQERFYQDIPSWLTFLCAALAAFGVIISAALSQGSYEILRQIAALIILLSLIVLSSYLAFSRWLILPPLVPMFFAFAIATPLTLLRRSLVLSHEITMRIAELSRAGQSLLPSMNNRNIADRGRSGEDGKARLWHWPQGAEWRARELKALNQQLLNRALFVDRALRSVDDGLIIAATDARIVFANPRAAAILGKTEAALVGSDLFERISETESSHTLQAPTLISRLQSAQAARESLQHLLVSRQSIEREITFSSGSNNTRHYSLRISTVGDSTDGIVIGIVAAFTDITRHRELQRTQRDVMALVTHELKTPLTAIQGMSEVLSQYEVDAVKRREMHSTINEEAKRLARMIDEYLDLTRLESGVRQLRLLPLRVEQILERALLLLDPVAESRGIKIIRNPARALPPLLGDGDLIARAVTNLVDNAIKFSPEHSTINVNARADGSGVLIEVIDQGCGIEPQFLGQIFEKFYRVPRAANIDIPGTGLGLALVREVAELHNGLVTVESQPGTGSTFSLYLGLMIRKGER